MLPCFFLLNARSLLPKLDELTALLGVKSGDVIAISPLSGIVICAVYRPLGLTAAEHNDLQKYSINTFDLIRNKHPDHGLVILGDFNDL